MQYTYNSKGELIDSDSPKKTTGTSSASDKSNTPVIGSSSNDNATGYGRGTGYSNRETAYRWSDGTTTYSNATDYRDAAAAAGKSLGNVSLVSATTYGTGSLTGDSKNYGVTVVGDGSGKSGFTKNIYSNNKGHSKAYEMAQMQTEYLSGLYGYDYTNGRLGNSSAYLKGTGDSLSASLGGLNAGVSSGVDWIKTYRKAADKQESAIQSRVDAVINTLNSNREDYERQFDEIARQAYVTNRQAQFALPQQLASSGLTGGASETSMLKLAANYENAVNENETNRLYMNKDIDTQIVNAQLEADSDIASMQSEYYLSAMQAYENQINEQNSLYMDMLDYSLQKDKLEQDEYSSNLDYELSLEKLNAASEADEYDKLEEKAQTLGKYGIFDSYSKLGYSADEISAMTSAYIAQNTKSTKTSSGSSRSSSKKSSSKKSTTKKAGEKSSSSSALSKNITDFYGTNQMRNLFELNTGIRF
ncbi:MAG: hypothetical protein VB119_11385 [Candidatus Metalachnospira sp.]|nr:hypothetical protein [Candidatus Metalachnospira sp.]